MTTKKTSLILSNSLLLDVIDHATEAVAITDAAGLVLYANPALAELFGLPADELLDHPLPVESDAQPPREIELIPPRLNRRGNDRPRLATIRSQVSRTDAGLRIVYLRDLSEHQELKQELRALALKDELTHLYNYRTFIRFAEHQLELATRMKKQMVLVRLRLLGLAEIGERHGAKLADAALLDLAEVLVRTFRKSDLLARCSQDEFAVLAINSLGIYQSVITSRLAENLRAFGRSEKRPYQLKVQCTTTWFDPEAPRSAEELFATIEQGSQQF
ncbi:hypothetical protein JCM30471_20160 [Desulfuromonas carbonis]|uniref:diguanylate cyclase domain-containing protein n=1 Tax=Desulfuromonas sp. DDH964 TaxID=1823759 RepID=UPI00078D3AF8|nr:diguanylate cyclase [Desulfuromonas sp. DDH964]AMV73599.1 sensor diguanylate cyclase/phosphodiesterase, HAMP and PAS domain-containing [Desulfuromonas sp. DDH964]